MSRKPLLPYDVRQSCIWQVRGYERRVKEYHEARREVIESSSCAFVDTKGEKGKPGTRVFLPHSGGDSRPAENKMSQLAAIEEWPETKRMRAVEQAKLHIGPDLGNPELRQRLTDGIILNCLSNRNYPYSVLDIPGVSERTFRRYKDKFLVEIAEYLDMI